LEGLKSNTHVTEQHLNILRTKKQQEPKAIIVFHFKFLHSVLSQ